MNFIVPHLHQHLILTDFNFFDFCQSEGHESNLVFIVNGISLFTRSIFWATFCCCCFVTGSFFSSTYQALCFLFCKLFTFSSLVGKSFHILWVLVLCGLCSSTLVYHFTLLQCVLVKIIFSFYMLCFYISLRNFYHEFMKISSDFYSLCF